MKKAEMQLVPLDNADVIATSSPKDGMILSGNNGGIRDLTISGYYNGKSLSYVDNAGATSFKNYLGNNISEEILKLGSGDIYFYLLDGSTYEALSGLRGADDKGRDEFKAYDGTYIWENGAFRMISSALQ